MWWLLRRSTMRRQYLPSSYALRVRDRCSLFVYVKRGELSLMNNTSYKKYTDGFPKNRRRPILGRPLIRDPWVWPDNPAYLPQPHLQKLHTEGQRTLLFYLAYPAYHALLHTKHATSSTTEGTPYRVPSGQDPWVWPDNPAYPPWPHLRYPLTSKDEDPNKKILARQSCSRVQRRILFYLTCLE